MLPEVTRSQSRTESGPAAQHSSFEDLYRRHYSDVMAYVLRRADPSDAEDLVAEVFVTAWRRLLDLPEDALPWLYGAARRVLANHRRAGRRRRTLTSDLNQQPWLLGLSTSADPADRIVDRAVLLAAFARLSPKDREVLSLVAWERLPASRAAMVMNCTSATFTVRLHRARRRLDAALAAVWQEAEASGVPR